MKIIKLHAKGRLEVKNIKNELSVLQNEVGGYIEEIKIFSDNDIIVLADDEGRIKRRTRNPFIPGLFGDVIICGKKGANLCRIPLFKLIRLVRFFGNKME